MTSKGGKGKGKGSFGNKRFGNSREGTKEESNWRAGEASKAPVAPPSVRRRTSESKRLPARPQEPASPRGSSPRKQPSAPRRKPSAPHEAAKEEPHVANRIANGSLTLPYTPASLDIATQKIIDSLGPSVYGTAWAPMVDFSVQPPASGSPNGIYAGSYFGGNRALVKEGSQWPVCLSCHEPMLVVCQIDRNALLHPIHGTGLVQLFACIKCSAIPNPGRKPTATVWANMVDLSDSSIDYKVKEYVNPQAPIPQLRKIVKWLPRKDYMHPEDAETVLQRELSVDEWKALGHAHLRSDKTGGYPAWLNNKGPEMREKLRCRTCDQSLRLLIQIDSNDNIALEWGHDGSLAVFECPQHPEQVVGILIS